MKDSDKKYLDVIRQDGRYPLEAFGFLQEGLALAARGAYGEAAEAKGEHHVTGAQLCQALRQEALDRYGLLARTVLRRWNINATLDFGNMVYLLVNNDLMHKTEEDSLEDFRDVYDFETAFSADDVFEIQS